MKRKYEFQETISPHLHCSICQDVFYKPVRAKCGHTFCSECLIKWTAIQKTCPQCRKKFKTNHQEKDLIATSLIDDFKVKCESCEWIGSFSAFKNHFNKNCGSAEDLKEQKGDLVDLTTKDDEDDVVEIQQQSNEHRRKRRIQNIRPLPHQRSLGLNERISKLEQIFLSRPALFTTVRINNVGQYLDTSSNSPGIISDDSDNASIQENEQPLI